MNLDFDLWIVKNPVNWLIIGSVLAFVWLVILFVSKSSQPAKLKD